MPHAARTAELWTLRQGRNAVRCVTRPHPMGVEVRYVMNEHPLISRVLSNWADVAGLADSWRARLESKGWAPTLSRRTRIRS